MGTAWSPLLRTSQKPRINISLYGGTVTDVADLLPSMPARERPTLEFVFGLEPIVQFAAWMFATFEINFVRAKSDFLSRCLRAGTVRMPHLLRQ